MKIYCNCQHFVDTDDVGYNITKYENKPVLKKRSSNGDLIVQEIFFYYICPKCERDVIEIHRYKRNAIGNLSKVEKELLVGEKATNYLIQSKDIRHHKSIYFKDFIYSKGIPLRYGKAINSETVRLRYINEASYDGGKIESKVIIYS